MKFKHDAQADAIYIYLSDKPYAYGKDLDDERRIDYAADNTPIGVELLCVSKGINLDGLPNVDEIAGVMKGEGIKIYEMKQQSYTDIAYSPIFEVKVASPTIKRKVYAGLKEEVTDWSSTSHSFVTMPK